MIFSVIVPFHNEERYLRQCLEALQHQDFERTEYEVIFIDNGSTDQSVEMVRHFPEVILLSEPQASAYRARNRGLEMAKGNIIAFTDADCAVATNWLTSIYEGMRATDAAIALGRCDFRRHGTSLQIIEAYENAKAEYVLTRCEKSYFFGYTRNMAVTAQVFQEIGVFREWARGGDSELVQRCLGQYHNPKVVYLREMTILHLEITGIRSWLSKINIYGQSNIRNRNKYPRRPLNLKINLEIYRYCVELDRWALRRRLALFFLLILSYLSFQGGRLRATWEA